MKGLDEEEFSSNHPSSPCTDLRNNHLDSACTEPESSTSKLSKGSLWSGFFLPTFSISDAFGENRGDRKKSSSPRNNGWNATVKKFLTRNSMWKIQERVLGLSKSSLSISAGDIWLLGVCYKISQEDLSGDPTSSDGFIAFVEDLSSRILFTYRKGFHAIGDSKYSSDVNWGCMLRSSQMLVAQALIVHRSGRSWRRTFDKPNDKDYIEILQFFNDSEQSFFSIHNLLQAGNAYGLAAGSWVGPYAMCRTWESLARSRIVEDENEIKSLPMTVYVVSGDEDGERGGAPVVCIEDASRNCVEFSKGRDEFTPILLLVPLVLGLDKINPRYIPLLAATFTFPQSLGILGGRPGASTYIIGVQDDKAFYLDPHEAQGVVEITTDNLEVDTSSYHCSVVRHVSLDSIDPSLAIGFYCRDKDEFDDFCLRASKLADESKGAPLFTVAQTRNMLKRTSHDGNESSEMAAPEDVETNEDSTQEDDWQIL